MSKLVLVVGSQHVIVLEDTTGKVVREYTKAIAKGLNVYVL